METTADPPRLQGRQTWLGVEQRFFPAMVRGCLLVGPLLAAGLTLLSDSARAGSVTAESIFSLQATRQQAMSHVPRGAVITSTRCMEIGVRGDSRYRCTVFYASEPSAPPSSTP
jgi:hypothetical protein